MWSNHLLFFFSMASFQHDAGKRNKYSQLDPIILSSSMLWTTASSKQQDAQENQMDNCRKACQQARSPSWPTHYLKLCFQQKQLVSPVARGILVLMTHWSHLLQQCPRKPQPWQSAGERLEPSKLPTWAGLVLVEKCVRGAHHHLSSLTTPKISQLTFHIDVILSALSHCNARRLRLTFHVYAAHLQSFSSCHVKANFCTS